MRPLLKTITERYATLEEPAWREEIAATLLKNRIRLVVIDDDPTGIQTVHGCLLLTEFTPETLHAALTDEAPFFYMLVNSRAMTEEAARKVVREAMEAVLEANRTLQYNLVFVSRSDSTLRGHFPTEPDTMVEVLAEYGIVPELPMLFVPSFFEAGRMTFEGVHYMVQGEELIPVAETEFARDNVFGYQNSRLSDYIVEKGGGAITCDEVHHIALDELRRQTPEALAEALKELAQKRCISTDSIDYNDRTGEKPVPWELGYFEHANRKALYDNLSKIISFRTENPQIFSSDSGDKDRKTWNVGDGSMGGKTLVLSNNYGGVIVVANQSTSSATTTVSVPQTGQWTNILTGEKVNLNSSYTVTLAAHQCVVLGRVN